MYHEKLSRSICQKQNQFGTMRQGVNIMCHTKRRKLPIIAGLLFLLLLTTTQAGKHKEPKSRITFSNLRDFITRLRNSSMATSRESLDDIKTNIQNLNSFSSSPTSTDKSVMTSSSTTTTEFSTPDLMPVTKIKRRPPYMYTNSGDDTTLPSTLLANMAASFSNYQPGENLLFQTTTPTTTSSTTSTPFMMPGYFGSLLTAFPDPAADDDDLTEKIQNNFLISTTPEAFIEDFTEKMYETTTEQMTTDESPMRIHHHHFHHYEQKEPSTDMNQW